MLRRPLKNLCLRSKWGHNFSRVLLGTPRFQTTWKCMINLSWRQPKHQTVMHSPRPQQVRRMSKKMMPAQQLFLPQIIHSNSSKKFLFTSKEHFKQMVRQRLGHTPGSFVFTKNMSSMPKSAEEGKGGKKVTLLTLQSKYKKGDKITMCTAYDYSSAHFVEQAGIDMILVGDSLGMVMLGRTGTEAVTMDEMIHHCKAVMQRSYRSFVVGDMPFGSYEIGTKEAVTNAFRLVKEGGVHAVKMEGGARIKEQIEAVVKAGIPVIGHIGLTPQSQSQLGGFRVQAKDATGAKRLLDDALALQNAGCSMIVIESVPEPVAEYVTKRLTVPTIGIGAGKFTSGQVLVYHDLLGLYSDIVPKFSKQYANLSNVIGSALSQYREDVETLAFPAPEHTYAIKSEELTLAFPDYSQVVSPMRIPDSPRHSSSHSPSKKRKIAVIGGGAMGSLLAGHLALQGDANDVWMISSWREHVDMINKHGLVMNTLNNEKFRVKFNATTNVNEVLDAIGTVDIGLILVKSPDTDAAAQKAARLVSPSGLVLSLQNGLGNRAIILKHIPDPDRVVSGVISHGGMVQKGLVVHTGSGRTTLAINHSNRTRVSEIAEMLTSVGISTDLSENLDSTLWGKLVVSAGINPLTAILKVKNGFLIENEATKKLFSKTVLEAAEVAKALNISLPYANPLDRAFEVARLTSNNFSSMLVDVLNHRKTEVDFINGVIVREGKAHGCDVTTNEMLVDLVHSQ